MADIPNYTDALARAREAKRLRDAKLAAEVAESAHMPELIVDGEYAAELQDYNPADFEAVFSDRSLTQPAPIKAVTTIPVKVPKDYTAIYCSILRETDKAALCSVKQPTAADPESKVSWWIPLSQVCYIRRSQHGLPHRDLIHVKQWVLDNHGYKPNQFTQA